ncbi:MAG: caspase family protein [Thermodesulfobacteriota bacterium]
MRRKNKALALLPLILCACLAAWPPTAACGPATGTNHALVIGCSQYDYWTALKSPAKEASALVDLLVKQYDFKPEDIVLLTDDTSEKPTREAIARHLEKLLRELKENDNLLVFFAGRSAEDENGDTYWIPKNGKKAARINWLRHADIAQEYIVNPAFSAKNVLILTDSPFSRKLLTDKPNLLTSYDLRFDEKLLDKARKRSREVIASGKAQAGEEPAPQETSEFGQAVLAALSGNDLPLADFETVLFAGKEAEEGPRLLRGRLDTPIDAGGQLVLTKTDLTARVNVRSVEIRPEAPVAGQEFTITAETDAPAREVSLGVGERKDAFTGGPTEWTISRLMAAAGQVPFSITALNDYSKPGEPYYGLISVKPPQAAAVAVESLSLSPNPASPGEKVAFFVKTAASASSVELGVEGESIPMKGAERDWKAEQSFPTAGARTVVARAFNSEKVSGPEKSARLEVIEGLVSVESLSVNPATGDSGSEFTFTARTGKKAKEVRLYVDGKALPMKGDGVTWSLSQILEGSGAKTVAAAALSAEGREGAKKTVQVRLARKSSPPSVRSVSVFPRPATAREVFTIEAILDQPAKSATITMDGRSHPMQGSGSRFRYEMSLPDPGSLAYTIAAQDASGNQGRIYAGVLTVEARVPRRANMEKVTANPETVDVNQPVRFLAYTTAPADKVTLTIEGVKYPMTSDRGTLWTLIHNFQNFGPKTFTARVENEDGTQSNEISGGLLVRAPLITIVSSFLEPPTIRAGQEVIVTATTDYPAAAVDIWVGDKSESMQAIDGSGKKWRYSTMVPDPMTDNFRITLKARNQEGRHGKALYWNFAP